jgi:hypothetical protein
MYVHELIFGYVVLHVMTSHHKKSCTKLLKEILVNDLLSLYTESVLNDFCSCNHISSCAQILDDA